MDSPPRATPDWLENAKGVGALLTAMGLIPFLRWVVAAWKQARAGRARTFEGMEKKLEAQQRRFEEYLLKQIESQQETIDSLEVRILDLEGKLATANERLRKYERGGA